MKGKLLIALCVLVLAIGVVPVKATASEDMQTYYPCRPQWVSWYGNYVNPSNVTYAGLWYKWYSGGYFRMNHTYTVVDCSYRHWDVMLWLTDRMVYCETWYYDSKTQLWHKTHFPDGITYLPHYWTPGVGYGIWGSTHWYEYQGTDPNNLGSPVDSGWVKYHTTLDPNWFEVTPGIWTIHMKVEEWEYRAPYGQEQNLISHYEEDWYLGVMYGYKTIVLNRGGGGVGTPSWPQWDYWFSEWKSPCS